MHSKFKSGIGVLVVLIFMISCGEKKESVNVGKVVYTQNCQLCHGVDGKLGLNGSKDLTKSELTLSQRIEIISNGKNAMTPFRNILSKKEIEAVAGYTLTLVQQK